MTKLSDNGNGDGRPSYLDSLQAAAVGDDRRCLDWAEHYPNLRLFLLGESKGIVDTGTKLSVVASPQGLTVIAQTERYGYQAVYEDSTLAECLERLDNDLDCGTVPWRPDWRRKRENNKRLEIS